MVSVFKFLFNRAFLFGIAILVQLVALTVMLYRFQRYFVLFYGLSTFISLVVVILIANGRSKPGYKIAWIIPILLFPIFGGLFYLMFGGSRLGARTRKKMNSITAKAAEAVAADKDVLAKIKQENLEAACQSHYIQEYAYSPPYTNTYTEYLPIGETKFERLIEELEKAKHFIFLEFFIIEEGIMWNTILEILKRKAKDGVDVRVIYDDLGSIMKLPYQYDKHLESMESNVVSLIPL